MIEFFFQDEDYPADQADKDKTPKQRLLQWIRRKLPDDVPVSNFTYDWNDGVALGGLVCFDFDDLFRVLFADSDSALSRDVKTGYLKNLLIVSRFYFNFRLILLLPAVCLTGAVGNRTMLWKTRHRPCRYVDGRQEECGPWTLDSGG